MRQISLKQYRAMDLTLFAFIMVVCQLVIHLVSRGWYSNQLYVVSPVAAVTAIVMMRWGGFAAIHAMLGGAVFCFFSGGSCKHLLIFAGGNLLAMAAMGLLAAVGKAETRESNGYTILHGVLVQTLMLLGRALVAALTGAGQGECIMYISTDTLSILFTLVLVWIARRVDGLYEDQIHYLRRIQDEDKTEGGETH